MKRCLQFVALALAALLAVPQGVAEGICQALAGHPQMEMHACCAAVSHEAMHSAGQTEMAKARDAEMGSCGEGCCSLAPQNSPAQSTPEKAKSDAVTVVPDGGVADLFVPAFSDARRHAADPFDVSAPARYLLLRNFRI